MKINALDSNPNFQPYQIVCLEHEATYLYAEVIQAIPSRNRCWVRPLLLAMESDRLYDLRSCSDLVWPLGFFRPALDTEVLPFLAQLDDPDFISEDSQNPRQQLHAFIARLWQARPLEAED